MSTTVNASEAATLVDRTDRRIYEWIRQGKLRAEPSGPRAKGERTGPTEWRIDVDDLARVPGVAIDRQKLAELEAGRSRSPASVLARLETLERELAVVRARLRALETRQPSLAAPSAGQDIAQSPPSESHHSAFRIDELRKPLAAIASNGWPASARGRARWIQQHGGPGASWTREWPDILTWVGPEDAIAAVRARAKGYEEWAPAL